MIQSSDINFNGSEGALLNMVVNYFGEATKEQSDNDNKKIKINWMTFQLCAFIGLSLSGRNSNYDFKETDISEGTFSVPRTIIYAYQTQIKELYICAKFVQNDFIISQPTLQTVWNMEKTSDDQELTIFLRKKTIEGAHFLVNLINSDFNHSVKTISELIDHEISNFNKRIADSISGVQFDLELMA